MGNAKKHVRLITVCLFVAVALLFTGCGGGDSEPVSEGRFVDSPVAGLRFETDSQEGITGSEGKFTYLEGERISFSIGDIYLGKTLAKPVITPLDLVEWAADETDASVTNICRFLQTLDDDGEPDNGILINESVRRGASGISVNFDTDVSVFGDDAQIQQTVSSLTAFTSAGQRPLRNAEQARQHFRNSLGLPGNDDPDIPEVVTDSDITDAGEVSDNMDDIPEPAADPEDVPLISDDPPLDNADSDDGGSDAGNAGENPPDTDTDTPEPVSNPEPADNSGNTDENPPVTDTDNSGNSIVTPTVPDTGTDTPEPVTNPEPVDNSGYTNENPPVTDTDNSGNSIVTPTVPDSGTETPEPITEPAPTDNTGSTGETPTVPDSGTDTQEPVTNPEPDDNTGSTDENPTVPDTTTETPEPVTEPEPDDNTGNTGDTPTVPDSGTDTPEPVTEPSPTDNSGNTGETPTVPDSGTETPEPVTDPEPADNSGNTGDTPTVPDSGTDTQEPVSDPETPTDDTGENTQNADPGDADNDNDGFTLNTGDCNDADADIHPEAEEICGDGTDQNCDGNDSECPVGENARLRISVLTDSVENGISEIWLNVLEVLACGEGGCQIVGGNHDLNLLDAENTAITLADTTLSDRKITHLRFVLGADNRITVNGESHALKIPSGEQSGLKVQWDKDIAAGELAEILLAFDLENALVLSGDGYLLHPVIRNVSQLSAAAEAQTAVVSAKKGGKFRKGDKFEIEVPDGAVEDFSILWGTEAEGSGVTSVFTMGPEGTTFKKPVKVKLKYDPARIPEGFSEEDLVILHDGEAIATVVNAEANSVEGEIEHFSGVTVGTLPTLKYSSMDPPEDQEIRLSPGQRFNVTFYLNNVTGIDAVNYHLAEADSSYDDSQTSYPSFTINAWQTGAARVEDFPAPQEPGTYQVYFKIMYSDSQWLPYLPGGTIYVEFIVEEDETPPVQELDKPILITPTNGATGVSATTKLDWRDVDRAEAYKVYVADAKTKLNNQTGECSDCIIGEGGLSSSQFTGISEGTLEAGKTYYWMVKAWAGNIGSSYSDIWRFTIKSSPDDPEVPGDPTDPDDPTDPGNDDPEDPEDPPVDPPDPCEDDDTPPTIHEMLLVQLGNMKSIVTSLVSGHEGNPDHTLNSDTEGMCTTDNGGYGRMMETESGDSDHTIAAVDECGNTATLGPKTEAASDSEHYGFQPLKGKGSPCSTKGHYQGTEGDPVNTFNGNFVFGTSDAAVAGPGGSDIRLTRTYNSLAALWTPASIKRYTPDGEEEVIAGPPLYFGKGWTSVVGEYLLVIDMPPLFQGLQMLYADGHTALFEDKEDGTFTSLTPSVFDIVKKEGNEYVLYNTACDCTLENRRFSAEGKLLSVSDRNGNQIKLNYEGNTLKSVENAAGRKIVFSTDSDGRIIQADLPEGINLKYEYTDGLLTAFTDGRGNRTVYVYDGNMQMTETVTPKGHNFVSVAYDSEYRIREQTVGETEKYTFSYSDKMSTLADAYGNSTVHLYDDDKRLVQVDHPDGSSEFYDYDEDFNRTYYMDQAGAAWHWTYDENGNRLTADGPLGWHREWEYNEKNQVIRMAEKVDENTMRETFFSYDDKGNLISFCNPLGACGSVTYDESGQPLEMTDFAGNKTFHAYDAEGDLISVTDAVQTVTAFAHDGLGRTVSMSRPMGSRFSYTYDRNSNLTDVSGPMEWHISFAFDANDNLVEKTDPNGGSITFEYNASDRPVLAQNQLDFNTAAYTYGLMNEIRSLTDAEGRSWAYTYDELLRVIQVSGPLDTHFSYAYNPVGKITDMTDANGIITHTDYDALYRPLSVVRNYRPGFAANADTNVTVSFDYNLVGSVLKSTDPEGYVTQFVYDLMGRRIKKTDAEDYEWVYEYDPMGNLSKVLNPRGFDSLFAYTPVYQLEQAVNPEGHAVSYVYDADGRLTDKTDAMNIVTHFEYDALGRMVEKARNYLPGYAPDSQTNVTTVYAYDPAGNLRFLSNPLSHQAEFVYDAAHRRTDFSDFEAGLYRFVYDKVNNLLSVTDAENNPTVYAYDDLNRVISRTNAEDETEQYQYDKMGNRTHLIEADGTVTFYGYDFIYRLNRVTQNFRDGMTAGNDVNVLTRYAYDARGLLTQISNANNAVTSFAFDRVGNMVQETDPLNNIWEYEYDGMRNRTARTDAKGDRTEYDYYPDDILEEIRYANGQSVQYFYDANNNRTQMKDWLGDTAWAYDPLNRITGQNDPFARAMAYAYDAASNRTAVTYPDGNMVNYTYSPNNWMKSVADAENLLTEYSRDKVGNVTHIANPNDTESDLEYDRVYRTLSLVNRQTGGGEKLNSAFAYTYNEVGHVTQTVKEYGWRNPSVATESYSYDGLHRLDGVVIDPIKNNGEKEIASYLYDPVGNRMEWTSLTGMSSQTLTDGFTKTYTYNAANQLLAVNDDSVKKNPNINVLETYTYDANGNRINRLRTDENDKNALVEGVDYTFDPENRLIQALDYQLGGKDQKTRTDRAVTDLEYDGGGRRMVQSYDPKSNAAKGVDKRTEYVFDGLDPVAEYSMLNGQRENFYRGDMNRIITMQHFNSGAPGQMYWYHYNHKGDVVGMTKQRGQSTHNYRYDAYGDVIPDNGNFTDPHNHYTLTGKEYDENTGLIWFGARHYDPGVGVWVTQDLYRGEIVNPLSLHRYLYNYANPSNYIDSYGYCSDPKYMAEGCPNWVPDWFHGTAMGFGEGVEDIATGIGTVGKGIWDRSPYRAIIDPEGSDKTFEQDAKNIKKAYNATANYVENLESPSEFIDDCKNIGSSVGQSIADSYNEDSYRFVGRLLPEALMTIVPGDEVRYADKAGDFVDSVSDATKTLEKIEDSVNAVDNINDATKRLPISVDNALTEADNFLDLGTPIKSIDSKSGVQFIQSTVDEAGNTITKRVGFDLNPDSWHVQNSGPHLNLQTQVNTVTVKTGPLADPHIPIDPTSIRVGDY